MGDVHKIPPPNGIYPQSLSSDNFHPEFGYLCPTPRMRLKLRVIAILASIGMTIGAISVLAPVHREGGENDRRELALSSAAAVPTADEVPAMTLPSSTALMGASVALRAPAPCLDLLGSFVNHQCEPGKSRARRRIANFLFDRRYAGGKSTGLRRRYQAQSWAGKSGGLHDSAGVQTGA
jgi:hypothetical protein